MKCKKIQVPLLLVIILSFCAISPSFYFWHRFSESKMENPNLKGQKSDYYYINPLLDCADKKIDSWNYGNLEDDIENIVAKHKKNGDITKASIYFRDLSNGPWLGYGEDEQFSPASLMKVPLFIAFLKMSEEGIISLDDKINSGDIQDSISQNIEPDKTIQANTEYSFLELLEYMIKYSDNSASSVLLRSVDPSILDNIYHELGLKIPTWGNTENYMTVRDYSAFFRVLYNASYLNRSNSELALKMLSQTVFKDGLIAPLPYGTIISHKFGERVLQDDKQLHDCGVVYSPKGDYLLCVMSRGQDFNRMKMLIQDVSKMVYDNIVK